MKTLLELSFQWDFAMPYGFKVRRCPDLEGENRPVIFDGILHVSPAIFDLLENSKGDELDHLLKHLYPVSGDGSPVRVFPVKEY